MKGHLVYAFHIPAYLFNTQHTYSQTLPNLGYSFFLFTSFCHILTVTVICLSLLVEMSPLDFTHTNTSLNWQVPSKNQSLCCFAVMSGLQWKSGNFSFFITYFSLESLMLKSEIQSGEDVHRPLSSQNETLDSTCFLKHEMKRGVGGARTWVGIRSGQAHTPPLCTLWAWASVLTSQFEPVFAELEDLCSVGHQEQDSKRDFSEAVGSTET